MATGTIKWFTPEKRFGFITPDKGDKILFVHHRFVAIPNFTSLEAGTRVEYEPYEGSKGLEARYVRIIDSLQKPDKILYGFSVCTFHQSDSRLVLKGWFLGSPVEKIEVYIDDETFLGIARLNRHRKDVFNDYPEFNNPNSGWQFECRLDMSTAEEKKVLVNVFSGGSLICKMKRIVEIIKSQDKFINVKSEGAGMGEETHHGQAIARQTENLVNKLLFDLAPLTEADIDRCLEDDDCFSMGLSARNPDFIKALAERFNIPPEILNMMFDREQKSWSVSIKQRTAMGIAPSLCARTHSRMVIYKKNHEILQNLIRIFDIPLNTFFDVGCQFGYLLVAAASNGFKKVVGAEIKPHFLDFSEGLKSFSEREHGAQFTYFVGDFGELDLGEDLFDLICCVDVLEHTPDLVKTIRNMRKINSPNGVIYIYQGNCRSLAMASNEPHYRLPCISILPGDLAVEVLESLGKVNEKAGYMVESWPGLQQIRDASDSGNGHFDLIDLNLNIRNGEIYPDLSQLDKYRNIFVRETGAKLMPLLSSSLKKEVQYYVDQYLHQIKEDSRVLSADEMKKRYLMSSWNISNRPADLTKLNG